MQPDFYHGLLKHAQLPHVASRFATEDPEYSLPAAAHHDRLHLIGANLLPNERGAHASQACELTRRQRRALGRKKVSRSETLLRRREGSETLLRRCEIDGDLVEFHGRSPAALKRRRSGGHQRTRFRMGKTNTIPLTGL